MNKLKHSSLILAKASKGNPALATVTVILFYVMFNTLESVIEFLLFGKRFEHWVDVLFGIIFIAYSAYCVYWCAIYNLMDESNEH